MKQDMCGYVYLPEGLKGGARLPVLSLGGTAVEQHYQSHLLLVGIKDNLPGKCLEGVHKKITLAFLAAQANSLKLYGANQ